MKLQQLIISLILIIILIIWYYFKNKNNNLEPFEPDLSSDIICSNDLNDLNDYTSSYCKIEEQNLKNIYNEYNEDNEDILLEKPIIFYNCNNKIKLDPEKKKIIQEQIKSFGVYIVSKKERSNIMTLDLHLNDNHPSIYYQLKLTITNIGNLRIMGEGKKLESECKNSIISMLETFEGGVSCEEKKNVEDIYYSFLKEYNKEIPIESENEQYKFWLFITINNDKIDINLNNNIIIKIKKDEILDDSYKSSINLIVDDLTIGPFDGKIGNLLAWSRPLNSEVLKDNKIICSHYICSKNKYNVNKKCNFDITQKNDDTLFKDNTVCSDQCIKEENNCSIIDCQKRCLECRDKNDALFGEVERNLYCPWSAKVFGQNPPNAPLIRGISDEKIINQRSIPIILLEWRKPISESCKIKTYIIEIEELGLGGSGIRIINLQDKENQILQKEINNLKPQTTYNITVSALGNIEKEDTTINLISKKSNVLTITTKGNNNKILKQTYDYFNDDNENKKLVSYVCDNETKNSDHKLNNINHNDIDIYKSLKNL